MSSKSEIDWLTLTARIMKCLVHKFLLFSFEITYLNKISGDDSQVVPPVPIPNTVVKHLNVESTWMETSWEDRKLPVYWPVQERKRLGNRSYTKTSQESSSKSEDDWLTLTVRWRHLLFGGVFFVCGQSFLSANYRLAGRKFFRDYRINDKIRTYVLPWKGRGTACGGGFDVVANCWKPGNRSTVRQTHHHAAHGPHRFAQANMPQAYWHPRPC